MIIEIKNKMGFFKTNVDVHVTINDIVEINKHKMKTIILPIEETVV